SSPPPLEPPCPPPTLHPFPTRRSSDLTPLAPMTRRSTRGEVGWYGLAIGQYSPVTPGPVAIATRCVSWRKAGSVHSPSHKTPALDRKSTRLNSSHLGISYAVFCLKKKK